MECLAVFDFDGTITRHDSFPRFLLHAYRGRRLQLCLRSLPYVVPVILAKLKWLSPHRVKERMCVSLLRSFSPSEFEALCRTFVPLIDRDLTPLIAGRIAYHQRLHHPIVIVSASLREVIGPWAAAHGIHHVLATEIRRDAACRFSGFSSLNCNGAEKVSRLEDFLAVSGTSFCTIAYGNSADDHPLLRRCDKAYLLKHSFFENEYHLEEFR